MEATHYSVWFGRAGIILVESKFLNFGRIYEKAQGEKSRTIVSLMSCLPEPQLPLGIAEETQ